MKSCLLWVCLFLSSCALFVDLSPEALHGKWLQYQRGFIGLNIYQCPLGFCGKQKNSYSWGSGYLGELNADDGLFERGFRYGRFDLENPTRYRQCRFFFKYETETGVITGFRFEESEPFACRFSGA